MYRSISDFAIRFDRYFLGRLDSRTSNTNAFRCPASTIRWTVSSEQLKIADASFADNHFSSRESMTCLQELNSSSPFGERLRSPFATIARDCPWLGRDILTLYSRLCHQPLSGSEVTPIICPFLVIPLLILNRYPKICRDYCAADIYPLFYLRIRV